MAYPINVHVDPALSGRHRVSVGLRPILAIPHAIVTGPVYFSFRSGTVGLLGALVYFLSIVSWITLLANRTQLPGIRELTHFYLRWRARSFAYMTLLADRYPPFGDGDYPVRVEIDEPGERDRLTIAFRCILAIPHLIVLLFLSIAGCLVTIFAWFAILFTGSHPASLNNFTEELLRWLIRVEAYLLLVTDAYPPFALEDDEVPHTAAIRHV